MASAVLRPGVAIQGITTGDPFERPANGAQLRCPVAFGGVGYRLPLCGSEKSRRSSSCAPRKTRAPVSLHRDNVHAELSEERELEFVDATDKYSSGLEGAEQRFFSATGFESGLEGQEEKLRSATGLEIKLNKPRMSKSRRKKEQRTYLLAAIASTTGVTALSAAAVVYRFIWQMPESGQIPWIEVFGTFSLAGLTAVGMEYWARWAHRALWHASLWHMHESHHKPRDGPFETNDVFAIINAVPAISLILYGFLNPGVGPAVCFGAGLGITMFGIAYMFVHDGLVHRRFPVGPIAEVPYFQKVAAAHQLHHADLFEGVPYGLFLGPKEVEEVGGGAELEKWIKKRGKAEPLLVLYLKKVNRVIRKRNREGDQ